MNEEELVGLICMMYDYNPEPKEANVKLVFENRETYPIALIGQVNNYLKRKGIFDEKSSRPTLKMYQLLDKYGIRINSLKQWQDEFAKTGHVTQCDKLGNKEIL